MGRKVSKKPVVGRIKDSPVHAVSPAPKQRAVREKKSKAKAPHQGVKIRARRVVDGKRVKIRITDNTVSQFTPGPRVIARSNVELALLSPFRFPIPQERVIAGAARYAGVFFVLVGGFFSFVNLEYASGTLAQMGLLDQRAQTTSGVIDNTLTTTTSGSMESSGALVTPDVRITVEGQGEVLSGMAVLMVNVSGAGEVKFVAERKSDGMLVSLGNAFRVDASTWRFYWDTRQYPDGEYRLRTVVKNQYGSYDRNDTLWHLVDNIPDANTEQTAEPPGEAAPVTPVPATTTAATSTADAEPAVQEAPPPAPVQGAVTLKVLRSAPLTGDVPLEVSAPGAKGVKVYARHTGSGALYYVGEASGGNTGVWTVRWDTRKVPDGMYALRVQASYVDKAPAESSLVERTVKNGTMSVLPPPSTTTATLPVGTATVTDTAFEPSIVVRIAKADALSGFVDVRLETTPVLWVELYALPKGSLTPRFLGLARKISSTEWVHTWQTTQTPNGDYELYARVKTDFGFTEGKRVSARVVNQVVAEFTETEEKAIETFRSANDELLTVTEEKPGEGGAKTSSGVVYVEPVGVFAEQLDLPEEDVAAIEPVLNDFRKRLNEDLNRLARAEREGDADELQRVKERIEELRADIIKELRVGIDRRDILDRIDGYLAEVAEDLKTLTLKNEQVLKERVGDAIAKDSDKDGITDYDEVNLYRTNPFSADTDGDSYIDSVEVRLGYNPVSAQNETLVTYESPKDVGVIREDLLTVETITTLAPVEREAEDGAEKAPRALISGRGLPNSFVTLYIFSTPIVLTVKTDAEGAWSYVFDKELDLGEHEVYIGITDNAGRIVAKSAPLPFVKTAVAFTEAEAAAAPVVSSPEPTLVDDRMLLLVASIAIVGLGLVLILLGLHVRGRREEPIPKTA